VIEISFAKLIGASGTSCITAPPPTYDSADSPYSLYAVSLALISDPKIRLNGNAVRMLSGIEHSVFALTYVWDPSQLTNSVENVLSNFSMYKLYPVIGFPLSSGAFQLSTTLSAITVDVG